MAFNIFTFGMFAVTYGVILVIARLILPSWVMVLHDCLAFTTVGIYLINQLLKRWK